MRGNQEIIEYTVLLRVSDHTFITDSWPLFKLIKIHECSL